MSELDMRDEEIIKTLRRHPSGLGFNELVEKCSKCMARATLSERLSKLRNLGLVKVEEDGWRRGRKKIFKLTEKADPLAKIIKDLEEFKRRVKFCVRVLEYKLKNKVGNPEENVKTFQKLISNTLDVLVALAFSPKPDTPVEVQNYFGLKTLEAAREILGAALYKPPLREIAYSMVIQGTFGVARNELDNIYNMLVDEAKKLGIKPESSRR